MQHFGNGSKESAQKMDCKKSGSICERNPVLLDKRVFEPVDGMEENYTGIPGSTGRPAKNENGLQYTVWPAMG